MSCARYRLSAPTGGLMLMSLSFSTTSRLASATPPLFSASNAMPALMAPSPMMATAWRFSPLRLAASAMPKAAEILVLECAVPKVS
ncbi:hypothetical protein D3C87_1714700 [compost metagenome]